MVKQPCLAPTFPEMRIYVLGLSAGGEVWEVLVYRVHSPFKRFCSEVQNEVQSVCALRLSRPASAWAFHKHTESYCGAHGLFQELAGASEAHVDAVLVLQGWNISPQK